MTDEAVAFFKGLYLGYLGLVLLGVGVRLFRRQWTRMDSLLMGIYLITVLSLAFQPFLFYGELRIDRRYMMIAMPLYLGWGAEGVLFLLRLIRAERWPRVFSGTLLVGVLGLFWLHAAQPLFKDRMLPERMDERAIMDRVVACIRADWNGAKRPMPQPSCDHYWTDRFPLVRSPLPGLGYRVGGQSYIIKNPDDAVPDYIVYPDGFSPDYVFFGAPDPKCSSGYESLAVFRMGTLSFRVWKRRENNPSDGEAKGAERP